MNDRLGDLLVAGRVLPIPIVEVLRLGIQIGRARTITVAAFAVAGDATLGIYRFCLGARVGGYGYGRSSRSDQANTAGRRNRLFLTALNRLPSLTSCRGGQYQQRRGREPGARKSVHHNQAPKPRHALVVA